MMTKFNRTKKHCFAVKPILFLFLVVFILSGCSIKPWVKPYQRNKLADSLMSPENNPLDDKYMNHAFKSREAARGAEATSGGGCGCN